MYVCIYMYIYIYMYIHGYGSNPKIPRLQEFISTFLVSKHHQDLQNNMDCATLQS